MSVWLKVKVVYGNNQTFDISDRIERFRYSSNTDKDNTVDLGIKKEYARILADEDRIITGNFLLISWGIAGGKSSPVIRMKISNVEPRYAERVTLSIVGADVGNAAKKVTGNDVKKVENAQAFLNDVLKPFAESWGLKLEADVQLILQSFDPTSVGSQGHMSKYSWIRKIANRNGFMCFIENKSLIFKKRNLKKSPYKKFTYNDGQGELLEFAPKFRETTEVSAASEVQTIAVDPTTGDVKVQTSSDNQDSLGKNLNKYSSDANFAGESTGKPIVDSSTYEAGRKVIVTPDASANQATADKLNLESQMDQHTAQIKTLGDPNWFADTIITVANVDKRNSGNWYVKSVNHDITAQSFYTCTAELGKYGSSAPNKANAAQSKGNVNSETGPAKANTKKTVPIYDSNATTRP
jgi:hypothetical protein